MCTSVYTYHTVLYHKLLTNISYALYPLADFQFTKTNTPFFTAKISKIPLHKLLTSLTDTRILHLIDDVTFPLTEEQVNSTANMIIIQLDNKL